MRHLAPTRLFALAASPLLAALIALATAPDARAQDLGGLPHLDWRILRSDSVDVITTAATAPFARRALALSEGLIEQRPLRLGERVVPIDVVVQPTTVVPNGFVGQTPWRSYLYATPPQQQDLVSTNEWVDALAIHEYRHVEQNSALLRGWTRATRRVLGNGGWSVATGLSTPNWFYEGDATYVETALTYAGRGRTPAFWALQRALALDSVRYTYQTARNGSLRRRVPDQYPLGVALITHGRHVHGDPWPAVVRTAGNFWPPFYPFSVGLKRATGLHTPAFYRAAYDSLHAVWRGAASAKTVTPADRLTPLGRQLVRYSHPQPDPTRADEGALVVQRRSQTRIPALVRIGSDGRERTLGPVGNNIDGAFHVAGGRATWSRVRFAERRPNRSYSDVFVMDYGEGGGTRRLTTGGRYFSPGLSGDGTRVVATEQSLAVGRTCLVEFAAVGGQELRRVCYDADLLIAPRHTPAGDIVGVAKRDGFVALHVFDFAGGARRLTPWTRHVIGTPFIDGERAVFSASFTGIDNVFSVALDGSGDITQLTEVAVGAYGPSVADGRLYFTEVDRRGDPVSVLAKADWLNRPLASITEPIDLPKYAPYAPDEAGRRFRENFLPQAPPPELRAVPTGDGGGPTDASDASPVGQPYNALLRGFQVHTVQPLVDNVEASVTLLGENVLSDLQADATVRYNLNEDRYRVSGSATLAKTWPWVRLDLQQAGRNYVSIDEGALLRRDSNFVREERFQEQRVGLQLVAPLQQVAGAYRYALTPQVGVHRYRFTDDGEARTLPQGALTALRMALSARRTRFTAPKQVGPREGQLVEIDLQRGLDYDEGAPQQLRLVVGQYLPGVHRSHSALARLSYRRESTRRSYQFADRFFYARGYTRLASDETVTASLDYRFPLLYPDVGFAGIAYCRRVRANVWGDLMRFRLDEPFRPIDAVASFGVDVTADLTLFNVQDLPVGVRFAYRLDDDRGSERGVGFATPQLLFALPL